MKGQEKGSRKHQESIQKMLYGKYQFICRPENEAILPAYKGSTFRGVFGHALKRVVKALKWQEMETFMGGMLDYSVVYAGDLKAYLPLLDFAEKAHFGKNTSLGLGKTESEPLLKL